MNSDSKITESYTYSHLFAEIAMGREGVSFDETSIIEIQACFAAYIFDMERVQVLDLIIDTNEMDGLEFEEFFKDIVKPQALQKGLDYIRKLVEKD